MPCRSDALDLSNPATLDAIIGGLKVYIYRRPGDGRVYWTFHDFSRFHVEPLKVMRLRKRGDWRVIRRELVKLRRERDRAR
jgi:hypothetical protein